ncbi:M15 family metallopeptidase [Candidatus Cardinium hertigii]|jgi:hypothetical protein|uniref:M15 family peptidase n=1 Tax=Candidatus Cardinium hertigii TaxID=247481 RepID=A0A3N2QBH3_9BACT|nr:M15 family metallopeptidase [Candidatus Cardinium hertigii]ROT47176.1 M15 family peptidase [Candidatus Cardinium hertigii]ROT47225.1 M15 family peptidase [Candidatus Cardinium hertigii]
MRKHEIYLKAYPEHISAITDTAIVYKDGTQQAVSDGKENEKSYSEKLNTASLLDQLSIPYIVESSHGNYMDSVKQQNYDPGRIRNIALFKKIYGNSEEEVSSNLVKIEWMPKSFQLPSSLLVTKVNNVSEKLKNISVELDDLPDEFKDYLKDPGGTFNWRVIEGTDRASAHSFGMTVDINVEHSNYWLWDYKKNNPGNDAIKEEDIDPDKFPIYQNKIPIEIVKIFEKYHFIWGGKWYHYDTMHFEYRPELFPEHLL